MSLPTSSPSSPDASTPAAPVSPPPAEAASSKLGWFSSRPLMPYLGVIGFIVLLFIALDMVKSMVRERSWLYNEVVREISSTWGGAQQFSGPVLLIPYTERFSVEKEVHTNGKVETVRDTREESSYLMVLPDTADFAARLLPEGRQRGIYHSLVYSASLAMHGVFNLPTKDQLNRLAPALSSVDYANAYVVMGLSHPSALREVNPLEWNNVPLKVEPGTQPFAMLESGFRVPVRLDPAISTYTFAQTMSFNGSGGLRFAPVGERTTISVESPWPHPSFQGRVLPVSREVSAAGFKATWQIPSLARSYANLGTLHTWPKAFESFSVGVDLHETGMLYHLVERAVKYGILFIGLTYVAFVVFAMGLSARLHPVQYGLVGLSLVVFYLVLLSLSEHVPFIWAYGGAAACTISMVSVYAGVGMRSVRCGAGMAVFLVGLYTLLYAVLQMEDYALLMGTALVVLMLGALMYVSRNLQREG